MKFAAVALPLAVLLAGPALAADGDACTKVRFSGLAIGTQLGFLMAGFAPAIVTWLGGVEDGGWKVIAGFTAVICLIATLSALTAKDTKDVPTAKLGLV